MKNKERTRFLGALSISLFLFTLSYKFGIIVKRNYLYYIILKVSDYLVLKYIEPGLFSSFVGIMTFFKQEYLLSSSLDN